MTSWRAEPIVDLTPPASHRPGAVRALAVAVAALLMGNGVVVTETVTGRDLQDLVSKGFEGARSALARALEPERRETFSGAIDEPASTSTSTTSTTAAPAATPDTTPATTPSTTPPATVPPAAVPAAASLDQVVAQLEAFVEKERGLKFKGPVPLILLENDAFRSRLNSQHLSPAIEEAKRVQGIMRALGLIAPGVDLAAQVTRLATGAVSGFYDPKANELVVRGGAVTPFVRKILVHELVHALDDQHFELDRPNLRGAEDESGDAFDALIEGIARRIEDRYVAGLPESERKAVDTEQRRLAAQIPRDIPQAVIVSYGFPYTAGARFANALASAGGPSRLNAALQGPPSTSEQIIRPEKYLAGEGAKAVPAPAAGGGVIRQGTLGQLTLSLMLAEVLEAGYAEAAADGWGGDRYVAWQNGGATCVRLVVDMDNPEENAELGEGLTDWALDRPGATIEGSGPFTVTRCA